MQIQEKSKLFKALSDPNRLRILKMLQTKPLCVCEISSVLGLANSTVSQHLSILKDEGFLIEERDGKWVEYRINPRPADARASSIITTLDFWIADDATVKTDREKVAVVDRNDVCGR